MLKTIWRNYSDQIIAGVRTAAAAAWVVIAAFIARHFGVDFSDDVDAQIAVGLGLIAIGVWNFICNLLGEHYQWAKWLLLVPKTPAYPSKPPPEDPDPANAGEIRVVELLVVVLIAFLIAFVALRLF